MPREYFETTDTRRYFEVRIDARGEIDESAELDNSRTLYVHFYYPSITSIVDMPADMGGKVKITFLRARYEYDHRTLPHTYCILRRIGHSDAWETVLRLPGTFANGYSATVPTLVDSTGSSSDYRSTFMVKLETIVGTAPPDTVYHTSCPDSGYSVNNLGPTATFLRSCFAAARGSSAEIGWELSQIDPGVEFSIARSENGGEFAALDVTGLKRDGLKFTFVDSRVEPGKSYVYKIEYALGGTSRLLFLSEEVRIPGAPLALYQNRPNPFNPSTTIAFSLPTECAVRLDVFDISGRLVARLVDGKRLAAGMNTVEWNGRGVEGRAVASGVYVYRLVAGKETLSRKLVLLR